MCEVPPNLRGRDNGVGETRSEIERKHVEFIARVGQLRIDHPKTYAKLQPALDGLDEWMRSVGLCLHRIDVRWHRDEADRRREGR